MDTPQNKKRQPDSSESSILLATRKSPKVGAPADSPYDNQPSSYDEPELTAEEIAQVCWISCHCPLKATASVDNRFLSFRVLCHCFLLSAAFSDLQLFITSRLSKIASQPSQKRRPSMPKRLALLPPKIHPLPAQRSPIPS